MRFLVDQDVFAATARFLRSLGHDAILVSEIGLAQASDEKLLQIAQELERILVTRDRDYGSLVFVSGQGAGVIYLRLLPSNQHLAHEQLRQVLISHAEAELRNAFVVVEPIGYRFRRIPSRKD
jgi:predicted nuclease of predicted toxin-antitoxin system